MGVVNVTPDSFSDGGSTSTTTPPSRTGSSCSRDGADLVDVGGESTRPGAAAGRRPRRSCAGCCRSCAAWRPTGAWSASTRCGRRSRRPRSRPAPRWSTTSAAGWPTRAWRAVVAEAGVPFVAMHWRGHSARHGRPGGLRRRRGRGARRAARPARRAWRRRRRPDQVVVDPGLGFAKRAEHNWALLARLDELVALGRPLLVGASRKGFLGRLLAGAATAPRPVAERDAATAAVTRAGRGTGAPGRSGCTRSARAATPSGWSPRSRSRRVGS